MLKTLARMLAGVMTLAAEYNLSVESNQKMESKKTMWSLREENVKSKIYLMNKTSKLTCSYQNCFSFVLPDPLLGLRPWTQLEDLCPPDPYCGV